MGTARGGRRLRTVLVSAFVSTATCLHSTPLARVQHGSAQSTPHSAHSRRLVALRAPRLSLQTEEERSTPFAFKPPSLFAREPPEPEPPEPEDSGPGLAAAGGVLATSAVVAEGVQIAGTAVLFYLGQQWTGTDSPVETVSYMINFLQGAGAMGYAYFAAAMITLQVVPLAAAFILTVSAGAIFGAVKGTAMVLSCSTISASISFVIARQFGRERLMDVAQENKQYRAIDAAFADATFSTSLTLITLLRLSPVLPFAWANYVFGLTGVSFPAYSLGTLLGCLPPVLAYVSAGQLGADIVVNGGDKNQGLIALGIVATLAAITLAGRVANDALKDMDLDLENTEQ